MCTAWVLVMVAGQKTVSFLVSCYFGTFCELVAVGVAPLCFMASPNPTQIHVLETNMLLNTQSLG